MVHRDDMVFGDAAAGVWLMELFNDCLREGADGRSSVDINLLIHKCKEEPKSAQTSMQLLAYELERHLDGRDVAEAEELAQTQRLLLGCLFMAYSISRGVVDHIPAEIVPIVEWHPVILDCADFVSRDNQSLSETMEQPKRRRRWPRRR